jgi:biotin transport system permease protein
MPAGIKLLALLFFSIFSVFSIKIPAAKIPTAAPALPADLAFSGAVRLMVIALLIITGALSAGIRPWELLRGSAPVTMMGLFVIALRLFSCTFSFNDGFTFTFIFSMQGVTDFIALIEGVFFGAGLLLSFAAGALFFSVTAMKELRESLGRIEAGVRRLVKRRDRRAETAGWGRLGLGISLMLGFIPRFFEIWEDADAAYRARSGKKSRRLLLIPLTAARMLEAAAETAAAMEARGARLS